MVVGYWDGRGCDNLVPGDASTQTAEVEAMIASVGNYDDYCLPLDYQPGPLLPDKSEPPPGDEHPNDCVADFMLTSQSARGNYYGWGWFAEVDDGLLGYVQLKEPTWEATASSHIWGDLTWSTYCAEIDADHPVVLLVDTGADGKTDHFVTGVGYGRAGDDNVYTCYDTWDQTLKSYEFAPMAPGQPWGIYGAVFFDMKGPCTGRTVYVDCNSTCPNPDGSQQCPFRRIQDGIDAVCSGYEVVVAPGTYYENINFRRKAITVTSTDPLPYWVVGAQTVIDGGGTDSVVVFSYGEGNDSVLEGFTITNGNADKGGGICCLGSSPTIRRNRITGNTAASCGGGIYCYDSSPAMDANTISGNTAPSGGGVCCEYSSPAMTNNIVTGNDATSYGGGIYCYDSSPDIANCTIADNAAHDGDGIYCAGESSPTVCNSIVWNDHLVGSSISVTYSDTFDPWPGEGNISVHPMFDTGYHLHQRSPCIDAGTDTCAPSHDIDGQPRPYPAGGLVDIGADEWVIRSTLCFELQGNCWHMITLPCHLINPDPWQVFDELRPPNKPLDLLSGNLHRYDHAAQGYVTYQPWGSSQFGFITPGDGYWLWLFDDETICYEAYCLPMPAVVDFPTRGWYLMGSPQPADTYIDDTLWYQGTSGPVPFGTIANFWAQDPLLYWSCSQGGYLNCGLLPIGDHYLRAFQGYWLYTFADDLTMEVPPP